MALIAKVANRRVWSPSILRFMALITLKSIYAYKGVLYKEPPFHIRIPPTSVSKWSRHGAYVFPLERKSVINNYINYPFQAGFRFDGQVATSRFPAGEKISPK